MLNFRRLLFKLNNLKFNKFFVIGVIFFVLTASAVGSYFYFKNLENSSLSQISVNEVLINEDEQEEEIQPENLTSLNVLLLGYGGPGHQGGYLSDVIQIAHLDFEKAILVFISIPRDLWVDLPNGQQAKINQALTLGNDSSNLIMSGSKVAKQMAKEVTGLNMNYFIGVDFLGFKRLIGGPLGGITVDVPETLSDQWYPIQGEELNPCGYSAEEIAELTANYSGFELEKHFECRYEHIYFKEGLNEMEGGDALAYVRSRHGSVGGDFSRSQRQRAVLLGMRDKIFSLEVLDDIPKYYELFTEHVITDIDLEILKYFAPALKNINNFEVREVTLSTENVLRSGTSSGGQFVLLPKAGDNQWNEVRQFVQTELE